MSVDLLEDIEMERYAYRREDDGGLTLECEETGAAFEVGGLWTVDDDGDAGRSPA